VGRTTFGRKGHPLGEPNTLSLPRFVVVRRFIFSAVPRHRARSLEAPMCESTICPSESAIRELRPPSRDRRTTVATPLAHARSAQPSNTQITRVPPGATAAPKGIWPLFVSFLLFQNSSPRKRRAASPVRPFHSKTKSARAGTRTFEPSIRRSPTLRIFNHGWTRMKIGSGLTQGEALP